MGFMGFSWQEYWGESPRPSPVDHSLSELFTMTCSSWVVLHGMAHNFTELLKPLYHDKTVTHETQLRKELSGQAKEDNAQLWMCWW